MPAVDFRNDVDGFAFKNDWTFNQQEHDEIAAIIHELLPAAAAIMTPVLAAASPIVVPRLHHGSVWLRRSCRYCLSLRPCLRTS